MANAKEPSELSKQLESLRGELIAVKDESRSVRVLACARASARAST